MTNVSAHATRQACTHMCMHDTPTFQLLTRRSSACLRSSQIHDAAPSVSRMSTFVFTLFTFCPPAPPLLANVMVTSPAS